MEKINLFNKKIFIFDLDGVIYLGDQVIPGAVKVINRLKDLKKTVYFLTNNATKSRIDYVEKLKKMRIITDKENIMTSAYATALYLKKRKNRAKIFVIGEEGLISELNEMGFKIYTDFIENIKVDFIVIGLDRNFTYKKLSGGLYYYLNGAEFIATNTDPTLPTEKYPLPGAGAIVAALERSINARPSIIIGKPNTYSIDTILEKENIEPQDAVIIGDRISTDILAGKNSNVTTIFVKTGAGEKEVSKIQSENIVPDIILNSINDLYPLLEEIKNEEYD